MFDVCPSILFEGKGWLTTCIDDGSMTADAREYTLQRIKSSKTTRVILISFKAGSTGKQCLDCALEPFPYYVQSQASTLLPAIM
jgi:hypothetical protein